MANKEHFLIPVSSTQSVFTWNNIILIPLPHLKLLVNLVIYFSYINLLNSLIISRNYLLVTYLFKTRDSKEKPSRFFPDDLREYFLAQIPTRTSCCLCTRPKHLNFSSVPRGFPAIYTRFITGKFYQEQLPGEHVRRTSS